MLKYAEICCIAVILCACAHQKHFLLQNFCYGMLYALVCVLFRAFFVCCRLGYQTTNFWLGVFCQNCKIFRMFVSAWKLFKEEVCILGLNVHFFISKNVFGEGYGIEILLQTFYKDSDVYSSQVLMFQCLLPPLRAPRNRSHFTTLTVNYKTNSHFYCTHIFFLLAINTKIFQLQLKCTTLCFHVCFTLFYFG